MTTVAPTPIATARRANSASSLTVDLPHLRSVDSWLIRSLHTRTLGAALSSSITQPHGSCAHRPCEEWVDRVVVEHHESRPHGQKPSVCRIASTKMLLS